MSEKLGVGPVEQRKPLEEEKKEKKEFPKLSMVFCTSQESAVIAKALQQVLGTLVDQEKTDIIDDFDTLPEQVRQRQPDVVFMIPGYPEFETISRPVTAIRNQADIPKQPVLIAFSFSKRELQRLVDNGVDISFSMPFMLKDLVLKLGSVPEFVGSLEDSYGDKMLKSKQGFYKEYKDKLAARSEITADTPKEVALLENIFHKNNVKDVLDAGGGEGRIAVPLMNSGYRVTDLDSSHDLLASVKEKYPRMKVIESDIRKLAVADGQYDAVTYNWHVLCEVLGVKGKRQVLAEAYRVLREGGVIVFDLPDRSQHAEYQRDGVYISYPDRDSLYGRKPVYVGYVPSEEEMRIMLEEVGFSNVEVTRWETKSGFPKISFVGKKVQQQKTDS